MSILSKKFKQHLGLLYRKGGSIHTCAARPSVGVKAIIVRDQQLLTIVKQYPEGIAYILPGGKQEFGETLEQAIQRECREELGGDMIRCV